MKVSIDVINTLELCRIEDNKLFLPDIQLERSLYMAVDKVLKCAGGKWNCKEKAHLFQEDIGDVIDNIVLTGEVCDIKKELQYYKTPPKIVELLISLAKLKHGDRILEPSAGEGAIAKRLLDSGHKVDTCEIHEPFCKTLIHMGCRNFSGDFLSFECKKDYYNKVIANPPFTRMQDIDHVNHMINCCTGRVVSVMSAGVLFREDRKTQEFRDRIVSLDGEFVELPAGAFKSSGTMVKACIVAVDTQ